MKKSVKILSILVSVVILALCFNSIVLAAAVDPSTITPDYTNIDTGDLENTAKKVMGLIRNVAIIAGVLLIAVLGVKYMLGSVEEKAEYKKSFVPLIVGAVVVMSATSIATMLFSLAD